MFFKTNLKHLLQAYFSIIIIFTLFICIFFIPFISNNDFGLLDINKISTTDSSYPIYQTISSNELCWPLPGYTRISSPFGYRNSPTAGATSFHGGIDIPAPAGTYIISAISGKVTKTGFMGSGGCSVVVNNGDYTVIFHHISPNYLVKPGDYVSKGQVIAQVGPKNVYGFANNPYKDSSRKSYKWCYNRLSFTFYN